MNKNHSLAAIGNVDKKPTRRDGKRVKMQEAE
jgi:hypothetical protein